MLVRLCFSEAFVVARVCGSVLQPPTRIQGEPRRAGTDCASAGARAGEETAAEELQFPGLL